MDDKVFLMHLEAQKKQAEEYNKLEKAYDRLFEKYCKTKGQLLIAIAKGYIINDSTRTL